MTIGEPTTNVNERRYVLELSKQLTPDSVNFPYGHAVSFTVTAQPPSYTWASPEDWDDAIQSLVDALTAAGWDIPLAVRRDAADAVITATE